jgi:hypothetical protein
MVFRPPCPGVILGVFGMHPTREGFTVVEADGFPASTRRGVRLIALRR